jgi:hypothetical protein
MNPLPRPYRHNGDTRLRAEWCVLLDDFGFSHTYSVEVDPAFPGDGEWDCTTVGYNAEGAPTEFLDSRWGVPVVLRVTPQDGEDWVLSVSGGNGLTSLRGIYATPQPEEFLVVVDGAALLVRADGPASVRSLGLMVTQILGVDESQPVLLINRNISVAALDASGVRWQTQRLCWDDLTIERVVDEEVHCSGEFVPRASFVLDLQSGDQLSGPRYAL